MSDRDPFFDQFRAEPAPEFARTLRQRLEHPPRRVRNHVFGVAGAGVALTLALLGGPALHTISATSFHPVHEAHVSGDNALALLNQSQVADHTLLPVYGSTNPSSVAFTIRASVSPIPHHHE